MTKSTDKARDNEKFIFSELHNQDYLYEFSLLFDKWIYGSHELFI